MEASDELGLRFLYTPCPGTETLALTG